MSQRFDLDALIDRWRGPLVGLLAARGASWSEASELAQDAFAEAWLHGDRFRGDVNDERAVGAWLAGIARNLHRAAMRNASAPISPKPLESASEPTQRPDDPDDEQLHALRTAIGELPDREREVIQAFYLEETSTARVAALLETTERAVEGLLRRARQRLKAALLPAVDGSLSE